MILSMLVRRRGKDAVVTVRSVGTGDFLRFVPLRELSGISYEIVASLSGHEVTNGSVAVQGVPEFVADLRAFAETRTGQAILTGTYDFRLSVGPHGRTGAAWVGFYVADWIFLSNSTHGRHILEGGLIVEGEYVRQMVQELTCLLSGDSYT